METKKIKVLIFNSFIATDGITKIMADYIFNIDKSFEMDIMTYTIDNDSYIKNLNVITHNIGKSKNIIKRLLKEIKIMKQNQYDVIHINGNYCSRLIECIAAKIAGIKKIIVHSHNTSSGNDSVKRRTIHKIFKKMFDFFATDYFACSNDAAKWMFSKKIIKTKKYSIIKNGIDIDEYKYNDELRKKIRNEYKLENKKVIGHIGRFQYQKNHEFLIELFNECKKIDNSLTLLLLGEGELQEKIKNKVDELNLNGSVIFLGNKKDAYKYYNAMDVFILPSHYEGLPIVAVEAQTNGLNVILSDKITSETKITNNVKYISLDDSMEKWVDAILESHNCYNRKSMYQEIIKNGYDIESVVKNLEEEYKK